MLFFDANVFGTTLAVLMAVLVLTINVNGQRPGHDPYKPGPKPSPGYVIGKCCGGSRGCMEECEDIQGKPEAGTKHDLGAHCKTFSPAADAVQLCLDHSCSNGCATGYIEQGSCSVAPNGSDFGCVRF